MSNSLRAGIVISPGSRSCAAVPRRHLDFEIRSGERHALAIRDDQQIRQHRQRLPALDHADHLLQRFEQGFALNAESHRVKSAWVWTASDLVCINNKSFSSWPCA